MKVGCFPVGGPTPTPANFYFLYRPSSNKRVQKQLTVEDVQPTRIFVNVGYLFNSVFFTLSLMNLSCSFAVWGFRVLWKKDPFVSFYRASIASRGICCHRVSVCLSVCPSVTSRSSTKMAKRRIAQTTPYDSTGTVVFWYQNLREIHLHLPLTVRLLKRRQTHNDITPNGDAK